MAYFRNNTVNLINLHYAVHAVAMTGGGAFFIIYLYKSGVPLPFVLASMALILAGRFAFRPFIVPIAVRFGLRTLVITGIVLAAFQYLLLAQVNGLNWHLLALCALSSIGDTFYWTSYHAYFASLGDHEHRGHQIAVREAITAVIGIISPVVAGWLLVSFGPLAAFGATAVLQLASALPIFFTPEVKIVPQAPGAFRASIFGAKIFMADGWTASGFYFLWQITLFTSLGESYVGYGGALAVAALAGAIGGLLLGRYIDAGHGTRAVWLALSAFAAVVALRAASSGNPALAVLANALGSLSGCLYIPTAMTAVYNVAKRSPCTLRFHVASEGGWDIGGATGSLTIAALLWFGVPIHVALLLPLLGITVLLVVLRRYYADYPIAIDTTITDPPVG